jgi:hypothetical protein
MTMRYKFGDIVLDTSKAERKWSDLRPDETTEDRVWANRETLYLSSKGRYWIERWPNAPDSCPSAWVVTDREAAIWLLLNNYDTDNPTIPLGLQVLMKEIVE